MFPVLQGNLAAFVKQRPEAASYYELDATPFKFVLPEPGFLEGVKSKDRAILKMHRVAFGCVSPGFVGLLVVPWAGMLFDEQCSASQAAPLPAFAGCGG